MTPRDGEIAVQQEDNELEQMLDSVAGGILASDTEEYLKC